MSDIRVYRLLKENEDMGLVSVPISILSHYFSKDAWETISKDDPSISFTVEGHVDWKEPKLLAIKASIPKSLGMPIPEAFRVAASQIDSMGVLASSRLVGPVRHKGHHLYALMIPSEVCSGVNVDTWKFVTADV